MRLTVLTAAAVIAAMVATSAQAITFQVQSAKTVKMLHTDILSKGINCQKVALAWKVGGFKPNEDGSPPSHDIYKVACSNGPTLVVLYEHKVMTTVTDWQDNYVQ